jgi:AcrR family transcriptional regulator
MTSMRSPDPGAPRHMETPDHADPILAAARSLALDIGFRRTTIADVARRAGVSRTTVYRQYEDLEAIWSALLAVELTRVIEAEAEDLRDVETSRERVVAMASQVTRLITGHPLLRRALDLDPELLLPLIVDRLGTTQNTALAWLTSEITAGQADGSIRGDLESSTAAMAVLLATQSFVFSSRIIDARDDGPALRTQLRDMIDGYLRQ